MTQPQDQTQTIPTQESHNPPVRFAVLDIETTGLDVKSNVILELGCILLDDKLNEIAEFSTLVNDDDVMEKLNELKFKAADEDSQAQFILNMHRESGLWADLANHPSIVTLELAQASFEDFLYKHGLSPLGTGKSTVTLAGSSVHFDVDYLNAYLPETIDHFHYRRLDVSGFKVAIDTFKPEMKEARDKALTKGNHRVIPDCRASIAELKWYLTHVIGAFDHA